MASIDIAMDQKVSQLYEAILRNDNQNIVKYVILEKGVNLNWKIPAQTLRHSIKQDFDGTLLHVAHAQNQIGYFKILLDHGADFTVQNEYGSSILHHIIENLKNNTRVTNQWTHLDDPFINMILSAHVQFKNSYNPVDKNGLSHLQVACMANHLEAVKFFLNNGALVDQHINMDSSVNPGFTSLHFAAEFSSFESAQLLLSSGADVHLKNADGITPLHLLVHRRLKILDIRHSVEENESRDTIDKKIKLNEKLINIILENDTSCCDAADDLGLSNFHVTCTLQDSLVAGRLSDQVSDINHTAKTDSPIYPGYTGIHFAAHCSVNTVITLIKKGADMMIKDPEGVTPLDICMRWFSLQNIHAVIVAVPTWKEITFSDGKTKLVDCILAMEYPAKLQELLRNGVDVNISLPNHSPLWPGSSMLHLVVLLFKRSATDVRVEALIKVCLDQGADIHAQDKYGSTPLHLAFRQDKERVINYLFRCYTVSSKKVVNCTDDDGLSYLHISSTHHTPIIFMKKILSLKCHVDSTVNATYRGEPLAKMKSTWTPLHVAAYCKNSGVLDLLVQHCGDILKTDYQGFTPIHLLLRNDSDWLNVRNLLDFEALEDCVVGSIGLTHLHVASWFNHIEAVKKLLDSGSDIEAVIGQPIEDEYLAKFAGCRPLHMAVINRSVEAAKELLQRGADILAKKSDLTSSLSMALTQDSYKVAYLFVNLLWNDEKLQKSLDEELGLTMLHIACYLCDLDKVKSLLQQGVDVNAKVRSDSIIWPGCTSLHVLMDKVFAIGYWHNRCSLIFELLLENGADVSMVDARERSSLLLIFKQYSHFPKKFSVVLEHLRDFSIKPIGNEELTCFHLACLMKNSKAVEKFLQQSRIDVNQPINYFSSVFAGCSPLHLAVIDYFNDADATQYIVELLLNHGAKLNSEKSLACTPLCILFRRRHSSRFKIMNKILGLVSNSTDLNIRTIDGRTLMEILLLSKAEVYEIQLLIDHGGRINACNHMTGEGYIALAYKHCPAISQIIMKSPDISTIDDVGRSAIHNAVAIYYNGSLMIENKYFILITELIKLGCNIDHRDVFGKTALHLAVEFGNMTAALALLVCGADFNIVDLSGKSPFSYIFEPGMYDRYCSDSLNKLRQQDLIFTFILHIEELKFLTIEVSKCNDNLQRKVIQRFLNGTDSLHRRLFFTEVEKTEKVHIGQSCLTLRSFLCETGAVSVYPSLTPEKRQEVTDFFENIDILDEFPELKYILKLQYRKAVGRLSLVAPAGDSLNTLLSIPLPYPCLEIILSYLPNSDLRNLIDAASMDEENETRVVRAFGASSSEPPQTSNMKKMNMSDQYGNVYAAYSKWLRISNLRLKVQAGSESSETLSQVSV